MRRPPCNIGWPKPNRPNVALWVVAISLAGMVAIMVAVILACAGFLCLFSLDREQRREEQLRREPWRQYER